MDTGIQGRLAKIYMERALDEARRAHRPAQSSGRASLIGYVRLFAQVLLPAMATVERKQI